VSTQQSFWTTLPYAQFKRDPHYYAKHDTVFVLLSVGGIALLHAIGYVPPATHFSLSLLLAFPVVLYLTILAHAFTHCASHGAWGQLSWSRGTPGKVVNRVVGELCGAWVLTKFASWEIVHRRHHRYSDDATRDPHAAERGYWSYAKNTLINVEKQLQQEYFDVHGDTPERRRYERFRSVYSFVSGVLLALFWEQLVGLPIFVELVAPAWVLAGLFVIHFNWVGHNAHTKDEKIEPTDLDHGWFWIGNRMFFGIYFHGSHHRMAMVFNPMHVKARAMRDVEAEPAAEPA
jgi:stearoyl-CoA desaturase (delta-9 desaturase)